MYESLPALFKFSIFLDSIKKKVSQHEYFWTLDTNKNYLKTIEKMKFKTFF